MAYHSSCGQNRSHRFGAEHGAVTHGSWCDRHRVVTVELGYWAGQSMVIVVVVVIVVSGGIWYH